jgi:hypothetical protein
MELMRTPRPSTDAEQRFIGGMWVPPEGKTFGTRLWQGRVASATYPLVELLVGETSIRVRLRYGWMRRLLGRLIPSVELSIDGVVAQPAGQPPLTRRVVLDGTGDQRNASLIFWCRKREQKRLLNLLEHRDEVD